MSTVRVEDLAISVEGKRVVDAVNFELSEGEVALLCGGVGSGKTLIAKALCGVLYLYPSIEIRGRASVLGLHPVDALRKRLAIYIPQDPLMFFTTASFSDEARLLGVDTVSISEARFRAPWEYAASEVFKEAMRLALKSDAKLLIIEEPSSYLDEMELSAFLNSLRYVKELGKAVIIVDHFEEPYLGHIDKIVRIEGDRRFFSLTSFLDRIERRLEKPRSVIEVRNLVVEYRGGRRVDLSNVVVENDEVVVVLGRNGRGKTSLVRALMGVARFRGFVRVARSALFVVPQNPPRVFLRNSVAGEFQAMGISDELLRLTPFAEYRSRNPYTLSIGESRALMLMLALLSPRKSVLVVDEISLGFDRDLLEWVSKAVSEFANLGMKFLLTTHSTRVASRFGQARIIKLG